MKYYVYVLRSISHPRFYIGMTNNLTRRLHEHNSGKTKSTKGFRPWELFFFEEYTSENEALAREKYLKSGIGRELIKDKYKEIYKR